jgi:TetR/AcrR family transcriptional repressor of multidrug resistance operon
MIEKRNRILRSTESILAADGFTRLSMKQVADRCGLATGTLYLYFKSKNDLVQQLHHDHLLRFSEYLFKSYDDTSTLQERFMHLWLKLWEFGLENPDAIMCKPQFEMLPKDIQLEEEEFLENAFSPIASMFSQGLAEGVFRNLPIPVLSSISFEACVNLLRLQILGHINLKHHEIYDAALACFSSILKK